MLSYPKKLPSPPLAEIVLGSKQNVLQVDNAALRFIPKGLGSADASAGHPAGGRGSDGRGRPDAVFNRLKDTMDLTSEQTSRIDGLAAEMRASFQALTGSGDRGAMREAFQQARQNMNSKLRAILNPEQRETFDEMTANRTSRREESRQATAGPRRSRRPPNLLFPRLCVTNGAR